MIQELQRDSVAIVTGGARGIGLAVVRELVTQGVAVACFDVEGADFSAFEEACRTAGVGHLAVPIDVRDQSQMREAARRAAGLGMVRYGVNCAGIDSPGDSETVPAEEWDRVVDVDLSGVFYSCQAQFDVMREHGGAIVNIGSISGHIINRGGAAHPAYSAAKAGVIHLSKALGVEWLDEGIRVNSVSPGYVKTALTSHNSPELNRLFESHTPIGRFAEVEEIASPVLFLLSPAASYITATDLAVDGGFLAW